MHNPIIPQTTTNHATFGAINDVSLVPSLIPYHLYCLFFPWSSIAVAQCYNSSKLELDGRLGIKLSHTMEPPKPKKRVKNDLKA